MARKFALIFSALLLSIICISPSYNYGFPFWIITLGASVADTLFHEMGHAVFGWLFGVPSIPSILTVFGADQAGGITLTWQRNLALQATAIGGLAYLCYQIYQSGSSLLYFAIGFTLLILAAAFSGYYDVVISYMGHGTSIIIGAFFIYRAFLNLDSRGKYERWLNAFFGFFLTLKNIYFGYQLANDSGFNFEYSSHTIGTIGHNDFVKIAQQINVSVASIGWFTVAFGTAAIIIAALLAARKYKAELA